MLSKTVVKFAYPLVAKTCLKWREALIKIEIHSLSMALSSECKTRAPLTTLRNRGRSPDQVVVVLDMDLNITPINCKNSQ